MTVLILQSGNLGPFKSIEVLSDRLRADNTDYCFTVIGDYQISEDDSLAPPPPVPVKTREQLKQERTAAVEAILVTTQAGHTFQGDETSQTRMARAIIALQATATPSVLWVLADNSVIQASAAELVEALALAGAAQAGMWTLHA